jgi:hypothetical protein
LLADDMVVPVRMDFATEFGRVSAHLAELHARERAPADVRFQSG